MCLSTNGDTNANNVKPLTSNTTNQSSNSRSMKNNSNNGLEKSKRSEHKSKENGNKDMYDIYRLHQTNDINKESKVDTDKKERGKLQTVGGVFGEIIAVIVSEVVKMFGNMVSDVAREVTAHGFVSAAPVLSTKPPLVTGLPTKQPAPAFTFAVWDENGFICILAKFEASFTVTYDIKGNTQPLNDRIPVDAISKGRCDYLLDEKPVLDVTWIGGFTFRMIFEKVGDKNWGINSIDLVYNTADSLFKGSIKGGKKVARSKEGSLGMFSTPLGKSYLCPSPPVINLYESKTDKQTVVVRLANVELQAFQIEKGKFAPVSRCSSVGFGSGVQAPIYTLTLEQDDSVPVVVGSITIMVSILVVVGYAVYRSWFTSRVDYDTMG
ncbi:lysosome-associated membrane glycoprotein 5-like [Oppia nitens]|uniref:lysosome-associated membrane glycoprotein 5-like n=1 Tax=Oppia nitens TaxID=1686743 RepID=UPI0023DCA5EC|nr:lysosome-associated membrane glycoprotein 5-like [Oppia nitens]